MAFAQLICLEGPHQGQSWPLDKTKVLIGRENDRINPDVPLDGDLNISRHHAWLRRTDEEWHLIRRGRTNGLWLLRDGDSDDRKEEVEDVADLQPWDQIQLGPETRLLFAPPDVCGLRDGPWTILLDVEPAFNLALLQAGLPPIRRAQIYAHEDSEPDMLELTYRELGSAGVSIGALRKGGRHCFETPVFESPNPRQRNLSRIVGPTPVPLTFKRGRSYELRQATNPVLLPPSAWLMDRRSRSQIALSGLVDPGSPRIAALAQESDAPSPDGREETPPKALEALYRCMLEGHHIRYLLEPGTGWGGDLRRWQPVRRPHQVLGSYIDRKGGGTCIDLAVTLTAALENLRFQPLIAVLDGDDKRWHAVVGVWNTRHVRVHPIRYGLPTDAVTWVDPNGATRTRATPFGEAERNARRQLASSPLVFLLDLAAARRQEIFPLAITPEPDEEVAVARQAALDFAREWNMKATSVLHLYGLLRVGSADLDRYLRRQKRGTKACLDALINLLKQRKGSGYHITSDFEWIAARAEHEAWQEGTGIVQSRHVLLGLVRERTASWNQVAMHLGVDVDRLKQDLRDDRPMTGGDTLKSATSYFGLDEAIIVIGDTDDDGKGGGLA